jgi:hypothetical protein
MANLGYIGHNRTKSKAQWLLDKGMTFPHDTRHEDGE